VKKTKRRSFFSKLRRFDNDVTSFVCKFWNYFFLIGRGFLITLSASRGPPLM